MSFLPPPIQDNDFSSFTWKRWFEEVYRELRAAIAGIVSDGDKGDITVSGGGLAWAIDNDVVTNAKLANMATQTFKGRTTAGTGDPEDLTVAQAKTLLNLSGTNTGDQTITLTSDVTGSGTGSFATTIANDAVTNAKLANMATQTIKGRTTAGSGDPEDLTAAQAQAVITAAGPKFYAYRNTVQSIASGAWTKVQYNNELFDTNSNYDSATNYRFTPTVAGYYQITAALRWDYATTGAFTHGLRITIGGSEAMRVIHYPVNTYADGTMIVTGVRYFNGSTDYCEVEATQNSGSNQNTSATSAEAYFCGTFVGA